MLNNIFNKKKKGDTFYIEKYFKKISINIDKSRFFYFDWPFGSYVFYDIEKYDNRILQKFSLFEIFESNDRSCFINIYNENKEYFYKKIANHIKKYSNISGFLISFDWQPICEIILNIFKYLNIPTILVLHEGVFLDVDLYYEGKAPICDYALVWGELHKDIFIKRGYPKNKITIIGSIKLNKYKFFLPETKKENIFKLLNLDINKKTILYCCQMCDNQWNDQEYSLKKQLEQIRDIIDITIQNNYNCVIRNSPSLYKDVIPEDFINNYSNNPNIVFDGRDINNLGVSNYLVDSSTILYYSDLIIGMNTTMQLEASLLNKPAIVVKYFDFDAKWNKELGLPVALNYNELEKLINENIYLVHNLIDKDKLDSLSSNYGFSNDIYYIPDKNIINFLKTMNNKG